MATISTPLLQDNTVSSVLVTQLFNCGNLYIKSGTFNQVEADEAIFEDITVTNLILNGSVTGTAMQVDLNLSPSELVATNASSTPISFPYGSSAGQIAIRDAAGACSFSSWTTPSTSVQFFFSTGNNVGIQVLLNSAVDSVMTVPDVGADANVVVYGDSKVKDVISSGDNIMHLKSTNNLARLVIGGPSASGTTLYSEFQTVGVRKASIQTDVDAKQLVFLGPTANVKLQIVPNLGTSQILVGGPLQPMTAPFGDLSNGNQNGFANLFLVVGNGTSTNFTNTITLSNGGPCILTLNTSNSDIILPGDNKSFTWTNAFITSTTRFLVSVQGLNGTINGVNVGVPYVAITAVGTGTCTVTTYNISSTANMVRQVTVAIMLLP